MFEAEHARIVAIVIDLQKRVYALEREVRDMKVIRKVKR